MPYIGLREEIKLSTSVSDIYNRLTLSVNSRLSDHTKSSVQYPKRTCQSQIRRTMRGIRNGFSWVGTDCHRHDRL